MGNKIYDDIDRIYAQLDIHNENMNVRTAINTGTIFNDDGKRGKDYYTAPQTNAEVIYRMVK